MAATLRAFLMTRSGAEWAVSVHRDLEDLLEAWKLREAPDQTAGVVHLGFERPPSREFDHLADHYPGLMLVTASAKFGLPQGFLASEFEVGRIGDLPIFLGVRGWGYSVDDSLLPKPQLNLAPVDTRPVGWVRDFAEKFPEAAEELAIAGIFDEPTYIAREAHLARTRRSELGIFRFEHYNIGDPLDPCGFARAAPPWLSAREFASMSTSVRVANVFAKLELRTVADLAKRSLGEMLEIQNFGRKSAADLLGTLREALEEGPVETTPLGSGTVYSTLLESIQASLFKYPDRARDIMLRRMGLGRQSETLQDVGERYGVTRERVRQIEAKVTQRLIREEIWDDLLTAKLAGLIENRRVPLPLRGIEALDDWFAGIGEEGEALAYLLANVSKGPSKILRIGGTDYIGAITLDEWETAISGTRRLLEGGAENGWTLEHCQSLSQAMLPERCKEFRELLWDHASRQAQFVEKEGVIVLVAFGRGAENLVQAVLAASNRPLHYTEIAALARERSGNEIEVRRAHSAAANVGLLFGRGIYGLDQHLPLSKEAMALVADEAEQIVAEGPPGRQWHTAEIATELIERGFDGDAGLDKYVVDIALRRSANLERLGRFVWSAGNSSTVSDTYRIDLRQAIISTLMDAGAPLSTAEIRQRVIAMRGVNKLFQISSIDPIIRIAPGTWGLNDRDLSIKRPDQPRILGALVELLQKRGTGLHYSELEQSSTLKSWGLSVTGFFSLATTDPRLRVGTGRYLFLQEWNGPRRESLAEAVSAVMMSAQQPIRFDHIVEQVEQRVGRTCERSAISACLQTMDAVHDDSAGTWTNAPSRDSDDDVDLAAE